MIHPDNTGHSQHLAAAPRTQAELAQAQHASVQLTNQPATDPASRAKSAVAAFSDARQRAADEVRAQLADAEARRDAEIQTAKDKYAAFVALCKATLREIEGPRPRKAKVTP